MVSKRSAGTRRLRLEALEGRDVPASVIGPDGEIIQTPVDTTVVVIDDVPPTGEVPVDDAVPMDDGEIDVIFQTTADPESETDTEPVDLGATVTTNKAKPSLGDIVTLTYGLANNGDQPSSGATVSALLPEGLTFLSATPSVGTYDMASGAWNTPTVYPGGPQSLTVKARVASIEPIAATVAIAEADQIDPTAANDEATLTISPVLAKLKVKQTISNTTSIVNGTVTITVTVRNTGPGSARNVNVLESLPAGLTFLKTASVSQGSFSAGSKKWKVGKVAAGTTATLQIVAQVKKTGRLEATAEMTATGTDETKSIYTSTISTVGTKSNNAMTWTYSYPDFTVKKTPKATGPAPSTMPWFPI